MGHHSVGSGGPGKSQCVMETEDLSSARYPKQLEGEFQEVVFGGMGYDCLTRDESLS